MRVCAQCGNVTVGNAEICNEHLGYPNDDWAQANRMMCDFVHRGIVPPAPPERYADSELFLSAA
jgi:hypothetical protein